MYGSDIFDFTISHGGKPAFMARSFAFLLRGSRYDEICRLRRKNPLDGQLLFRDIRTEQPIQVVIHFHDVEGRAGFWLIITPRLTAVEDTTAIERESM